MAGSVEDGPRHSANHDRCSRRARARDGHLALGVEPGGKHDLVPGLRLADGLRKRAGRRRRAGRASTRRTDVERAGCRWNGDLVASRCGGTGPPSIKRRTVGIGVTNTHVVTGSRCKPKQTAHESSRGHAREREACNVVGRTRDAVLHVGHGIAVGVATSGNGRNHAHCVECAVKLDCPNRSSEDAAIQGRARRATTANTAVALNATCCATAARTAAKTNTTETARIGAAFRTAAGCESSTQESRRDTVL